jgi:hypothetical protein
MRRYGPLIAIVAVIAIVVAVVALNGGDDNTNSAATTTTGGTAVAPEGAISWTQAQKDNLDVTWGAGCDQKTGRVAMPFFFAPECYANADDNGGATADGVTADTIKVVLYERQEPDAIYDFITAPLHITDTVQQQEDTYRGYAKMFEAYYQTYGRHVEFEILHASGGSSDDTAARADAVKAAALKPFAVWGGPALSSAWADEIAAHHIICMGCLAGSTDTWLADRAPYVYQITQTVAQARLQLVEYLSKQVAGQNAVHAGDPALQSQPRKFGLLYIQTDATSDDAAVKLKTMLADKGIALDTLVPYKLDPTTLADTADTAMAQLKTAGVTSVLFSGDPIAPATFTRAATKQAYFPEWILTGSALTDTTAFARTYDQQQWAHAFGISSLTARSQPELGASYFLYQWFTGSPPPAVDSNGVLFPNPAVFYAGVQQAGPKLTAETYRDGQFAGEPTPHAITNPSISFGDHGIWPQDLVPDFAGIDDDTEVWWDPTATGPDEIRRDGTGMWQYTDGGARYLLGSWPEQPSKAFDPNGAIALYTSPPPSETPPDYPSPAGG